MIIIKVLIIVIIFKIITTTAAIIITINTALSLSILRKKMLFNSVFVLVDIVCCF